MNDRQELHDALGTELRSPDDAMAYWNDSRVIDPRLLEHDVRGNFWDILHSRGLTLIISREYEHFLMGLSTESSGTPIVTSMRVPHPSGIAFNAEKSVLHVACTRKPNQIYDFRPVVSVKERHDKDVSPDTIFTRHPLLPSRVRMYPGCLYIHDLALIDGELHANAVGENAVIHLAEDGSSKRVWWPTCIEEAGTPNHTANYIQLNSIAAGKDLHSSFFSASSQSIGDTRPGDANYPVDGKGVIFSGQTREPIVTGLTRPHSARLYDGELWVDNSGYGQVCKVENGALNVVATLPGWTRGLCIIGDLLVVATSRVLPRFKQYAPGLDVEKSECGVHLLDRQTGKVLGSMIWPYGNQVFAIECVPQAFTRGFPSAEDATSDVYYSFSFTTP